MSTTPKQYSYSFDEERYSGAFADPITAALEGFSEDPLAESVFIGENVPPQQPETFIRADLLIEHVQEQDEYGEEWAESWLRRMTREQNEELTAALRATFAAWLDKHSLRPNFYTVENVRRIDRAEAGLPPLEPLL